MKNLDLNFMGVQEMNAVEMKETDGGFLPLLVIFAIDAIMICCSAVALGMRQAQQDHK